jgi:diaminopimelate decarboxylase
LPRVVRSPHLLLEAVACHIGSQLPSAQPLEEAVALTAAFARECIAAGAPLRTLDAGGGWPVTYGDEDEPNAPWAAFGQAVAAGLARGFGGPSTLEVTVEPGRALIGDAGALLCRVLFVKEQAGKRFVILDGGMTELLRPALYSAYHATAPVRPRAGPVSLADVVGPVCETGDFFARDRLLPPLARGDLVLVRGTGAYGAAMASRYNGRPLAAEVMVEDGRAELVRPRGRVEDLHWDAAR